MKTTEASWNEQVHEHEIVGRIEQFFREHQIGTQLHRCGIRKCRGISPMIVLHALFGLSFLGDNIFRHIVLKARQPFGKDVVYDFLRCERFNWRRFLLLISAKVAALVDSLTSSDRQQVLIIDDSTLRRPRSKKVELLSRVYDHSEGKFIKGFRMLTLGWSDGISFLPLDFALLSSRKDKNRLQDSTKEMDKRSCGYKRRVEAQTKSTDLLEPMVRRALSHGIRAKYLLMDSWFAMPSIISKLHPHLPVICMVKNTPKIHYGFAGIHLPLKAIYNLLRKRPGKAKILTSTVVTLNDGLSAKLVFIRDRRKSDWLALLSTDITLSEEEIVCIYGKRWDIEVFFKMVKQHLNLESGIQARDFDSLIAHTTIVMMRHIFLSLLQRRHDDPKTLGVLFHACCEEMKDLSFLQAIKRILALLADQLRRTGRLSESLRQTILATAYKCAIDFLQLKGLFCQRTQAVKC